MIYILVLRKYHYEINYYVIINAEHNSTTVNSVYHQTFSLAALESKFGFLQAFALENFDLALWHIFVFLGSVWP